MTRRILVLNERDPKHPLAGGAEVHVYEIFRRLVEQGYSVTHLAASFPGGAKEEIVDGVRVVRLVNRYLYYAVVSFAARREARRGYDVVIDVLNKLPFLSPWTVPLPCFSIVHHLFGTTAFRQVPLPIALLTYLAEKLIPSAYRGVPMLAISPSTKDDLIERGLASEQVRVVPPGLDHESHRPPAERPTHPTIAWVGRLEPYKRADVMIDAMVAVRARVPAASLVIVGAGGAREALEARARERGVEDIVRFTGFVSDAEKVAVLQGASAVVQTSEKEGWGMTVIEGNACGAPSVATDVPGLRDSVVHEQCGLLIPYGDVDALAEALLRLLTDADLHARLVRGGLEWAGRFTWENVARDTAALIEEAIEPTGRRIELSASPFDD